MRLSIALVSALALALCASPDQSLPSARSVLPNIGGVQDVHEIAVAEPPPGLDAPWAVKLTWEQKQGELNWGHFTLPLGPANITGYSFDLYVETVSGPAGLNVYLTESDLDRWAEGWDLQELAGAGWQHIDLSGSDLPMWRFGDGRREPDTIQTLVFEPHGPDSRAVFWVANIALHSDIGLQSVLPLMLRSDCPPPTAAPDIIRLPRRPRCYMGLGIGFFANPETQQLVRETRKRVPNLGVAVNTSSWRPEWRDVIRQWRRDGVDVRAQNGGVAGMRGLITQARAWGVTSDGRSRNQTPGFSSGIHGVSYCHPATRGAVRRVMAAMRGIGIPDFEQIDYVWPWFGGMWGYGDYDIAAYGTDLRQLDEGLRLYDDSLIDFWGYLSAYGTGKLQPSDLGLTSWREFHPHPPETASESERQRTRFVFTALAHYEWLKFAQAMGREAACWGGRFMATMNPENINNGGDYLLWNLLQDTGEAYFERFGNPKATHWWRHYLPYLRRAATRAGKRLGVIFEVGVGGHGKPYLDPELAYCLAYDVTASGQFDDMQNEWMDEGGWAASQDGYHRDRLLQWLATAHGFNRARADKAGMPRPQALAIGLRSVVHNVGARPSYLLTRGGLLDTNIDCDYADLTMDPADWEDYEVLIYTPWESAGRHLRALPEWLKGRPGRTLITHGAVPTTIASGLGRAPIAESTDAARGQRLGLGTITRGEPIAGDVTHVARELASHIEIGRSIQLPGRSFDCRRGQPVLRVGDRSVVTKAALPDGGRVYYLNYAAGQPQTRTLDADILRGLLESSGCMPTAQDAEETYCHIYTAGPGHVAVVWSRDACDRFDFAYRTDIDQRMRYRDDEVSWEIEVAAGEGDHVVYDFLEDAAWQARADRTHLPLALRGRSCAILYYGHDTPDWRRFLDSLRAAPRPGTIGPA